MSDARIATTATATAVTAPPGNPTRRMTERGQQVALAACVVFSGVQIRDIWQGMMDEWLRECADVHADGFYRVRVDGHQGVGYRRSLRHSNRAETWDVFFLTERGPGTEHGALCIARLFHVPRPDQIEVLSCDSESGSKILEIVQRLEP